MASSGIVPRRRKEEWKYDVYVSFKGGDTRHIFVGHLYAALTLKGISVFMEDKIDPEELLEAIKESRWAVVVFSKDYANSSWCLEELSNIMENSKQIGQRVLPVFHHVDPSDIREQKGELATAFETHENNFKGGEIDKVNKWREALTAAASLYGKHILPDYGGEVEFISNLAEEISAYIRPHGASRKKDDLVVLEPWVNALYSSVLQTIKGEWTHDVFLSFSDKDTGNNFTDRLYAAQDREIRVFRRGYAEQTISEVDVEKAILRSRLFVVVFSENYATSSLCLEELSTIMNCHDLMGQKVLSVFYHVKASDIRVQAEGEEDKVVKWNDALTAATNLPGLHISPDNMDESAYLEEIVQQILADFEISERKIGKILVSDIEIGRGSNGTIVLEGMYGPRLAAVKRIVKDHYDNVASKEVDNLIKSDHHPNIVRYYDVEYDQDFVYIALERCICSLHELILSPTNPSVQSLQLTLEVNGYPSPELLKVMSDTVAGLAHLHELGIIHRDLNPQNVLITKDSFIGISAKISGLGISKFLPADMSSLTSATGYGSSGWLAPETFGSDPQITRAVDLFGYGCLLFFCITGGRHPFGDEMLDCDINIKKDCNPINISLLDDIPEALDLVSNLIHPNPDSRPTAAEAYHHPLFWDSQTRLEFFRDGSDYIKAEYKKNNIDLLKALESIGTDAFGSSTWDGMLDSILRHDIGRYRKYEYDSVRDLLRVIRDILYRYSDLPKHVQDVLGSIPTGLEGYFRSRFPKLLMEVYKVLKQYCGEEDNLNKYYKKRSTASEVHHPPCLLSGELLDFNPIPMASSSSLVQTRKRVWKYDVYLSFRGDEDTRNNFVGPLYAALTLKGMRVFEEDKIGVGQLISEKLPKAIRESRVAVVVFSKNYASSSWCLEELSLIMECQNQMMGQHVIPVFYRVNPSNVRYQNGDFATAFQIHEDRFKGEMDKVNKWRNALAKAANLSGQYNLPNNRGLAASINKVVGEVSAHTAPSGVSSGGDLTGTEPETDDGSHPNVKQTTKGESSGGDLTTTPETDDGSHSNLEQTTKGDSSGGDESAPGTDDGLYSSVGQPTKREWIYDVFLSYSEKDTGNNFTDHLCAALDREGKRVFKKFKDNERQPISADVVKAIKESRFAVVVFSENYATYSLCWEELSNIMESHKQIQTVIPVFYHVDREDIRVLAEGEMDKLKRWTDALTAATDPKLFAIPILSNNTGESEFVKKIVNQILDVFEISERTIGKLFVTKKEIGRGSNGTIVLEGLYDGQPAAVKRIVKEYHASKEIDSLKNSRNRNNIVNYYDVESDQNFVYIAMEPCICNLHEFILSQTNPNTDRLQQLRLEFDSFELQKANGYPSPELLKVMRDTVAGLAHLHDLRIIHRDLKPQDVLICKDISAKISDLGISNLLPENKSSFTSATGYGTSGWQAPETLRNELQTNAVDLFSYGCLLFFCITGGRHPFGDDIHERDTNIKNGYPNNLSLLKDIREAFDLVSNLISRDPKSRPTAAEAYHHPLFWDSQRRLEFFRDGSNYIEAENNNSDLQKNIQNIGIVAYAGPMWDVKFGQTLLDSIHNWYLAKTYHTKSMRDLIRLIRNMFRYYKKQSPYIQSAFVNVPTGLDEHFCIGFPKLLIEVYKVLKPYGSQDATLKKYYETTLVTHT